MWGKTSFTEYRFQIVVLWCAEWVATPPRVIKYASAHCSKGINWLFLLFFAQGLNYVIITLSLGVDISRKSSVPSQAELHYSSKVYLAIVNSGCLFFRCCCLNSDLSALKCTFKKLEIFTPATVFTKTMVCIFNNFKNNFPLDCSHFDFFWKL